MGARDHLRKQVNFWISDEMHEGLQDLSEKVGLPVSQVIRDAITSMLALHGKVPDELLSTPVAQRLTQRVLLLEERLAAITTVLKGVGLLEETDDAAQANS